MPMQVMLSWYAVKDLEKAKSFYGEVLGLDKGFEMQGWVEFSHGKGATAIGLAQQSNGGPGATVVLRVDDLDRARAELVRKGVKFEGEVQEVPGVIRLASFRDPFGNPLQLAQVLQE